MTKIKRFFIATIVAGGLFIPTANANAISFSGKLEQPLFFNENAEITLDNATIDMRAEQNSGIEIEPGYTLTLNLTGDNYIYGGTCYAGIYVVPNYNYNNSTATYDKSGSAKLIIKGSGNLTVIGGNGSSTYNDSSYRCEPSAGIGGSGNYYDWFSGDEYSSDFGEITIASDFTGKIVARGGSAIDTYDSTFGGAAGIGGGGAYFFSNLFGNGTINIHNGTIEAYGVPETDSEVEVSINGGAGIGSGAYSGDSNISPNNIEINITGGDITAIGGYGGAGIGGGYKQDSGIINISGGNITAHYDETDTRYEESRYQMPSGAGIGGGRSGSIQTINITGGDITAIGLGSAGIGGGHGATSVTINPLSLGGGYHTISSGQTTTSPNTTAGQNIINISGKNTKISALSKKFNASDDINQKIESGAAIGSGAPYAHIYTDDIGDEYAMLSLRTSNLLRSGPQNESQPTYYTINIADNADVTAIGSEYGNAIGTGGIRNENDIFTESGAVLTIDDTVNLFASNNSDDENIAVLPGISTSTNDPTQPDIDDYLNTIPLTFKSADKYLVLHNGNKTFAYNNLPDDWNDKHSAKYEFSSDSKNISIFVEDDRPIIRSLPENYILNRNFAIISSSLPEELIENVNTLDNITKAISIFVLITLFITSTVLIKRKYRR